MRISRWYRWTVIAAIVAVIVLALHNCGIGRRLAAPEQAEGIEAALTLQTVTLEQPDENGKLLWRLKAKAVTYSPDNQRAELKGLNGEFFQDGQIIYTVVADEGEVQQNGETLFLRGNLVATSKQNALTLEGDQLKWEPKEDRLMMGEFEADPLLMGESSSEDAQTSDSKNDESQDKVAESSLTVADMANASTKPPVRGVNPKIEVIARVVTVANKENRVELAGGVAAKSKEAPWLTFESANLTWFTKREFIETAQPLKVEQYEGKAYETVRDRVIGKTGQVDLSKNIVTLDKSVQLDSLSQPLKVQSEIAVWDVEGQTVVLDKPVSIEQPEQKITAFANQAKMDLAQAVIYLQGNVRANGDKNEAQLVADRVTWKTGSQDIVAEGNVNYQQAANPAVSMSGTEAVGNLEKGTVLVTGGSSSAEDVVIEFVPGEEF